MKEDRSILELFHSQTHKYSVEIFPPDTNEKIEKIIACLEHFVTLGIQYVNITCKSEKSEATLKLTKIIREAIPSLILVPHITAFSLIAGELRYLLQEYRKIGIRNIFLIRGDRTANEEHAEEKTQVFASTLVKKARELCSDFSIGVAGYPELHFEEPNFIYDTVNLKQKVECGADYIVSQLFFDNERYFDFVKRCRLFGITVPIIPGITLIKNKLHAEKLAKMALGSVIPAELLSKIYAATSNEEAGKEGERWCKEQARELLRETEIPQLHFFTFNQSKPFENIIIGQL